MTQTKLKIYFRSHNQISWEKTLEEIGNFVENTIPEIDHRDWHITRIRITLQKFVHRNKARFLFDKFQDGDVVLRYSKTHSVILEFGGFRVPNA